MIDKLSNIPRIVTSSVPLTFHMNSTGEHVVDSVHLIGGGVEAVGWM